MLIAGFVGLQGIQLLVPTQNRPRNWTQAHGQPRLIDVCGERRLFPLVHFYVSASIAQVTRKVNR